MKTRLFCFILGGLALATALPAQQFQRRFTMRDMGDPRRGKCTVEVRVDGSAEVAIQGDTATLRNLAGRPPEWRRFECNNPLPRNPADFRFSGVDGRGRQTLMRDPRQGGVAVIRIDDPDNGSEGYTFDIFWDNGGGYGGPGYNGGPGGYGPGPNGYPPPPPPNNGPYDRGRDYGRDRRFTTEQALDVCRDAIRD